MAALGLHCCAQAFSNCGEWGLLFIVVHRLFIAVASLVAEHGLQVCGLQQLWYTGSVVVAHGPSCSAPCGIFLDKGSNPCPLHWQVDSYPLHHQGSPYSFFQCNCKCDCFLNLSFSWFIICAQKCNRFLYIDFISCNLPYLLVLTGFGGSLQGFLYHVICKQEQFSFFLSDLDSFCFLFLANCCGQEFQYNVEQKW